MKSYFRLIAMLLAFACAVAVFSGCETEIGGDSSADDSQQESLVESSDTSEEYTDGTEIYNEAVKKFKNTDDFSGSLEYELTRSFGTESNTEVFKGETAFFDYGKNSMSALLDYEVTYNEKDSVKITETYFDSKSYMLCNEVGFVSEAVTEDWLKRQIPALLLDADNYAKIAVVSQNEENGNSVLEFTQPESLESWLSPQGTLVSANGKAEITSEGTLSSVSYSAAYKEGTVLLTFDCTYSFSFGAEETVTIAEPEDLSGYETVSDTSLIPLFVEAMIKLKNTEVYQLYNLKISYSDAVGVSRQEESKVNYFDYESEFSCEADRSSYLYYYDYDKEDFAEETYKEKCTYSDGVCTVVADGEEYTETLSALDVLEVKTNQRQALMFGAATLEYIDEITASPIDGYVTLTIQGNSDYDKKLRMEVAGALFENKSVLELAASDYEPEKCEYMLTIDTNTAYPAAINAAYKGYHTIQGYSCELAYESVTSLVCGNPDTYYLITEKHHSDFDVEPSQEDKAEPLFYKVTGQNGEVMWLLGTIHMGDNRTAYLPDEIYEAFDASDAAAFEIDVIALADDLENVEDNEELLEIYQKAYYYGENDSLNEHIGKTLYRDALTYLVAFGLGGYGENISYYAEQLKPSALGSSITNVYNSHYVDLCSNKGVDMRLLERAKESGMNVYEIEDRLRSFEMEAGFSEELQEFLLYQSVYTPRSYYVSEISKMFEAWCKGDKDALYDMVNNQAPFFGMSDDQIEAYEEYQFKLADERDALMLEKAIEYLESGETVFYSVGLAHLLDKETGLLKALEKEGYTIELVQYK